MTKILKYLGILVFMIFSFYYTDKIANFVSSKNPIKKEIIETKNEYDVSYVNAVINNNTIIPGLEGLEVDINRSFNKMKKTGIFNPNNLIFDSILPKISLKNNLTKTIIKGNKLKNMIAIIIDNNEIVYNYSVKNNIKINAILNDDIEIKDNVEYINAANDKVKYSNNEKKLDKLKINKNLCLINYSGEELCKSYYKYLIKENIILTKSNYVLIKNNIESGSIILISSNASLEEFKLLIKDILFKDLEINYLSVLISEER